MKISLKSDFYDYYDHWFERCNNADFELIRNSRSKISKQDQFKILRSCDFNAIGIGLYRKVQYGFIDNSRETTTPPDVNVVVYTDEYAHAGEGKILISFQEATKKYHNHLFSLAVDTKGINKSTSKRYLSVGDYKIWLEYKSDHEWMSNCGDVEITILSADKTPSNTLPMDFYRPLYAIDFVEDLNGCLIAIDYNESPAINGTGLENIYKPREIYELILEWFKKRK